MFVGVCVENDVTEPKYENKSFDLSCITICFASGVMSSNQFGEADIRSALVHKIFCCTQIPECLWLLAKDKTADAKRSFRDRRQQGLIFESRIRCAFHANRWSN